MKTIGHDKNGREIIEINGKIYRKNSEESMQEKIFSVLAGSEFEGWYNEAFEDYITGEEDAPTKEEILDEIKIIFRHVK